MVHSSHMSTWVVAEDISRMKSLGPLGTNLRGKSHSIDALGNPGVIVSIKVSDSDQQHSRRLVGRSVSAFELVSMGKLLS